MIDHQRFAPPDWREGNWWSPELQRYRDTIQKLESEYGRIYYQLKELNEHEAQQ